MPLFCKAVNKDVFGSLIWSNNSETCSQHFGLNISLRGLRKLSRKLIFPLSTLEMWTIDNRKPEARRASQDDIHFLKGHSASGALLMVKISQYGGIIKLNPVWPSLIHCSRDRWLSWLPHPWGVPTNYCYGAINVDGIWVTRLNKLYWRWLCTQSVCPASRRTCVQYSTRCLSGGPCYWLQVWLWTHRGSFAHPKRSKWMPHSAKMLFEGHAKTSS